MAAYAYRLPRKYRYRGYRRRGDVPKPVLVIGAAVLAMGAAGAHQAGHAAGHGATRAAAGIPRAMPGDGSLDTPSGWDHALLAALSVPQTSCNFSAVAEWERREGGGFGNQASFNALNVNPGAGTQWPGHAAIGAWAFPDAQTGLQYTVATLNNGYYGAILAALRQGTDAQAVCNAIMASPWAASHYSGTLTASC